MLEAVKLEPHNEGMRAEYRELVALKTKKEKEWYTKMSGFYDSTKLKKIEEADRDDEKLRHKIKRQCFRERAPRDMPEQKNEVLQDITEK